MKTPPPPLTLATDSIPDDLVPALRALLQEAERKELAGFAFTAMYLRPKRSYIAKAIGLSKVNLTFTIGTLVVLIARLLRQIFKGVL